MRRYYSSFFGPSTDMLVSLSMGHNHCSTSHTGLINNLREAGLISVPAVYDTMLSLDRKAFGAVDYTDKPQSLSHTTITSPHMHAVALNTLHPYLAPETRILDLGCGTGLTSLALAQLANATVHAVDYPKVLDLAEGYIKDTTLVELYNSIPDSTKYHCIHVGFCVTPSRFQDLALLLEDSGVILAPVGNPGCEQELLLGRMDAEDGLDTTHVMTCMYSSSVEEQEEPIDEEQRERDREEAVELFKAWREGFIETRGHTPSHADMLKDSVATTLLGRIKS